MPLFLVEAVLLQQIKLRSIACTPCIETVSAVDVLLLLYAVKNPPGSLEL